MLFGLATGTLSGAQTIVVSWTTAAIVTIGSVSADGVDQTTPFNNGAFAVAFSAGPSSVTITTAVDDMTIDATVSGGGTGGQLSSPSPQTQAYNPGTVAFTMNGAGGYNLSAGASTAHTWVLGGTVVWTSSGANFKAAAAGGRTTKNTRAWPLGV